MPQPAKNYIKEIIEDLKDPDKDIRYTAAVELAELAEADDLEMNLLALEKLAKEAAFSFPKTRLEWDDPSYHIVSFITNFRFSELAEAIIGHYPHYSAAAKELAISYISSFKGFEEKLMQLLERDLEGDNEEFPLLALLDQPHLAKTLVESKIPLLENEKQKDTLYELLSLSLDRGLMEIVKPDFVRPLLASDYQKKRELYKSYEKDYALSYVYGSWKDTYLSIQGEMCILLSLMEYYYDEKMKGFVQEALHFKDSIVRMSAIITALKIGIPIEEKTLQECAENPETSEPFYMELSRIKREEAFPIKENRQVYFAKSHLFRHAVHHQGYVPEEVQIKDMTEILEEDTAFRYYLAAIKEEGTFHPAWVGAYPLSEGDDLPYYREETHILEEEYQSAEKHMQEFLEDSRQMLEYEANKVYYTSKPRVSRWFYILYPYLGFRIYQAAVTQDPIYIVMTSLFFALVTGTHLYQWKFRKQRVEMTSSELRYTDRDLRNSIKFNEIGRISIEKAALRSRLFDRFAKNVVICDKKGAQIMKFPLNAVVYEDFIYIIESATEHLEEQPRIDKPE
ncbi:hypothetical protein LRR81_07600 [Metabacillus sp. GX 13764]|uniref:hypothetical protein n=1 Tax=Metabacillus kandeliae TaxID=2900151 RepID=UPI001E3DCFC7|nr:hypothetical protein [Metabacillus kandeliae]MCD7034094.1 hypothetical protein [Metabacillus kandeliae]